MAFASPQDPAFTGFTQVYPVTTQRYEAAIDLDLDGVRDLVGWWYRHDGKVKVHQTHMSGIGGQWRLSTGVYVQGQFGAFTATAPHATATGDLDGDGRGDMVAAIGREIIVVAARPQTAFGIPFGRLTQTQSFEIPLSHHAAERAAIIADFDGDGRDEFVLAFPDEVRLYRSDSAAVLRIQSVVPVIGGQSSQRTPSMEVGEFDGDPGLELALFSPDLNRVSIFSPTGTDLGSPTILRTTLGGERTQVAAGDVDGDGDHDVVVFREEIAASPPAFEVLRNDGQGELVPEAPALGGPASDLVDIDGDGDLDGVCCGGGGGGGGQAQPENNAPSVFRISINDGTGHFSVAASHDGIGAHRLAAAYDIDHDGDVDLVSGIGVILNQQFVGAPYCSAYPNSTGHAGVLRASGRVDGVDAPLVLTATSLPASTLCLLVYGFPAFDGGIPIGGGQLCIEVSDLHRGQIGLTDGAGASVIDLSTGGLASLPLSYTLDPGNTLGMHVWHRDTAASGGSNLTRALAITIGAQ